MQGSLFNASLVARTVKNPPAMQDTGVPALDRERVTGRKARGLQAEEIGCKSQTFFSLSSAAGGNQLQASDFFFFPSLYKIRASRVSQLVNNLPAMWETWVQSLGWEDSLVLGSSPGVSREFEAGMVLARKDLFTY